MYKWIHKFGSPPFVYRFSRALAPWLGLLALGLFVAGLYLGLVKAPADYEQGESYRLIYIHVPSAWLSMFVYLVMAVCSLVFLVWRMKLADMVAKVSAPIGASFTFIALVTGAIWGKPTWGTWWVWDARLTSELVLLFLYFGYMALRNAIEHPATAARAASIIALVGVVNLPIIHYSVDWWNTLHQPATITRMGKAAMHISMLVPLLIMVAAAQLLYFYHLCIGLQAEILTRESRTRWVRELLQLDSGEQVG